MVFTERYSYDPEKDFIGTGGFSKIFRAFDTLREENVALKFFSGDVKEKYGILAEAKRLIKLNHPNVIRFYDLETVEFTNIHMQREKILIGVLEYIDGGDLKAAISKDLCEEHKYQIVLGLLDGLSYIHEKKIVHRDLKPGNIMLRYNGGGIIPKLIDFGISKQTDDGTSSSSELLGTVEYMAPEQFNPEKYGKVSYATDLWSFAVMIYELYASERLFGSRGGGQQTEQVISKILLDKLPPDFSNLPLKIQELLSLCLVRDSRNRVQSAQELIDVLESSSKSTTREIKPIDEEVKVESLEDSGKPIAITKPQETELKKDKQITKISEKAKSNPTKSDELKSISQKESVVSGESNSKIETEVTQVIPRITDPKDRKSRLVTPVEFSKKANELPKEANASKVSVSPQKSVETKVPTKKTNISFRNVIWMVVPLLIAGLILIMISSLKKMNTNEYLNDSEDFLLDENWYDSEDSLLDIN